MTVTPLAHQAFLAVGKLYASLHWAHCLGYNLAMVGVLQQSADLAYSEGWGDRDRCFDGCEKYQCYCGIGR